MAFIFPEDKADFTAPNGVTYSWDGEKWVTKTFKQDEADLANYVTQDDFDEGQAVQDEVINTGLETQAEILADVDTLENKVNALEGGFIDGVWTFEEDDRIPRAGEFALRAGADAVTGDWSAATAIIFSSTDFNGVEYTFEGVSGGDVIRCGASDGTGAEYRIVDVVAPGTFTVQHIRSSPDAADEQEYAFTFLSSFDPAGLATIAYVDAQDELKLNLTGGTMTGNLAMNGNLITAMGDPVQPAQASTKRYVDAEFGLSMKRFGNNDVATGREGESTVFRIRGIKENGNFFTCVSVNNDTMGIYNLREPEETHHAATKAYVDNAIAESGGDVDLDELDTRYLRLTGGTLTDRLFFQRRNDVNMVISPNSGDVSSSIYACNGGAIRFRSVPAEDLNNSTTHVTIGKLDDGSPGTYIYHLQDPEDELWAANKRYVDQQIAGISVSGDYLPLSGGTLTNSLAFNRGSKANVQFAIEPNSGSFDTNIISISGGQMRFRSTHTEDVSDRVGSHIVLDPNNGTPETKIYNVVTPTDNAMAANKKYVDDQNATALSGTSTNPTLATGQLYWNTSNKVLYIGN